MLSQSPQIQAVVDRAMRRILAPPRAASNSASAAPNPVAQNVIAEPANTKPRITLPPPVGFNDPAQGSQPMSDTEAAHQAINQDQLPFGNNQIMGNDLPSQGGITGAQYGKMPGSGNQSPAQAAGGTTSAAAATSPYETLDRLERERAALAAVVPHDDDRWYGNLGKGTARGGATGMKATNSLWGGLGGMVTGGIINLFDTNSDDEIEHQANLGKIDQQIGRESARVKAGQDRRKTDAEIGKIESWDDNEREKNQVKLDLGTAKNQIAEMKAANALSTATARLDQQKQKGQFFYDETGAMKVRYPNDPTKPPEIVPDQEGNPIVNRLNAGKMYDFNGTQFFLKDGQAFSGITQAVGQATTTANKTAEDETEFKKKIGEFDAKIAGARTQKDSVERQIQQLEATPKASRYPEDDAKLNQLLRERDDLDGAIRTNEEFKKNLPKPVQRLAPPTAAPAQSSNKRYAGLSFPSTNAVRAAAPDYFKGKSDDEIRRIVTENGGAFQ